MIAEIDEQNPFAHLLGRLLERTMDLGVVYCMTSNYAPDELYKDVYSYMLA